MSSAVRATEDPNTLRRQLLIELSVLRRRYAKLAAEEDGGGAETAAIVEPSLPTTSSSSSHEPSHHHSSSSVAEDDAGALCQSDRDAIEALFHSVDDFTREFNEGRGGLERGDIVSKIMRGAM